ncbi:OLC1v1020304C1 [Oldenlandia corymbosa var. corymbosa]|uniref:OLC1v1020304C1 n=1 Tax=Oldenlandia corymbosa var. corymbosa TaxID=529605 RepID=A0AAV1EGA1_OLDCO|nr:OLC1v1020304C1 [Oldenlandia corymbosa var. corymbosa]
MATQRMIPSMVVDMLLQNNISDVKLYSSSDNVMAPFGGTNIKLSITLTNQELQYVKNDEDAKKWINENIKIYMDKNVIFRYVMVGTQPLSTKFSLESKKYINSVDVHERIQRKLDETYPQVKAIMSHYVDILQEDFTKPSEAEFKPELKDLLTKSCRIIRASKSSFWIDYFPILVLKERYNNDTEFGFFDNNSTTKFTDGDLTYSNAFEAMYDSVVWALEKLGFPDIPVSLGSVGWPTDGHPGASTENAERFLQGLIKFAKTNKGTPKRPGISIDAYIHNLADENALTITIGEFTRHWGIYHFDGKPKLHLDFEGKERKIYPVSGLGITHMPRRWCVFDDRIKDVTPADLDPYYKKACSVADCTAAAPGGSCGNLPFPANYSYGFNMGFQGRRQKVQGNNSCDYGGYGVIVTEEPTYKNCVFPVEIISAETTNFLGQLQQAQGFGIRPSLFTSLVAALLQILFIVFSLRFTCQ